VNARAERRRYQRTESTLPLKISKSGLDVISESRNISSSGVYCRVDRPIPLMCKVSVTLLLPARSSKKTCSEKVMCKGVVVRSEPLIIKELDTACQNIAIFFTDIAKKDKDKIAQYVIQSFKKDLPSRMQKLL
jgi:hypothetical protein